MAKASLYLSLNLSLIVSLSANLPDCDSLAQAAYHTSCYHDVLHLQLYDWCRLAIQCAGKLWLACFAALR